MFALVAAAAGIGYYFYWKKQQSKPAITPIAFAQTAQAISMAMAHDRQAGASIADLDSQQLTIAYMRGNIIEITNTIAVLKSRNANYTAQAFISRAAQIMTPPLART